MSYSGAAGSEHDRAEALSDGREVLAGVAVVGGDRLVAAQADWQQVGSTM
jgi:hypothetical protein